MKLPLFLLLSVLVSCGTYTISPESFKKQYIASDGGNLRKVEINNALLLNLKNFKYHSNNIKVLKVVDRKSNIFSMPNDPTIVMVVTLKNKKIYPLFFDTVILKSDTLEGSYARFSLKKTNKIPFDSIVKIVLYQNNQAWYYKNVEAPAVVPRKPLLAESNPKASKINEKGDQIFENRGEQSSSVTMLLDSIDIKVTKYNNLDHATCLFNKSKTSLQIMYKMENGTMIKFTSVESSPIDEEIFWVSSFYLEDMNIFFEEQWLSNNDADKRTYDALEFNKNLNVDFLKKLAMEIYVRSGNKP